MIEVGSNLGIGFAPIYRQGRGFGGVAHRNSHSGPSYAGSAFSPFHGLRRGFGRCPVHENNPLGIVTPDRSLPFHRQRRKFGIVAGRNNRGGFEPRIAFPLQHQIAETEQMTATKAKRKSPGGIATNDLVMSAYAGSSDKVFPLVMSLYVDPGSVVADVTYGKGVFWKLIPTGFYDLKATDLFTGVDCRELPYADGSLDCVVFDPPFMHSPGGSAHAGHQLFENNYRNNKASFCKNDHGALLDLYFTAADEAFRVLKKHGVYIIKCQDETCSNAQRLTHVELINELTKKQFVIEDLFVVVRHARPGVSRVLEQLHARKRHSYFLVFLKQKRKKRLHRISGKEVALRTKPSRPQNSLSTARPRDRDTTLVNIFPRFVTKLDMGSLLRAERKAKGKTLIEIADALAISPNTVWQLEKQNRGTMAGLQRICDFLGLEWAGLPAGRSLRSPYPLR